MRRCRKLITYILPNKNPPFQLHKRTSHRIRSPAILHPGQSRLKAALATLIIWLRAPSSQNALPASSDMRIDWAYQSNIYSWLILRTPMSVALLPLAFCHPTQAASSLTPSS